MQNITTSLGITAPAKAFTGTASEQGLAAAEASDQKLTGGQ